MIMGEKEFYSVKEVAKSLGISTDRIYEYLRSGHINATQLKKGSKWLIPRDEVDRIKRGMTVKKLAAMERKEGLVTTEQAQALRKVIDKSKAISEIQELVVLHIQGVPRYLYELSQECYIPDFPFLGAEALAKGVLTWEECHGPCQFPDSERPERYKEWLECVRKHQHMMREHKLIVGEGDDGKPWLRLPSRYKYPDFEKMFPTLLDIELYKLICSFEEIGGKCIYLWVQLTPYLVHHAIEHIKGAKEALSHIKYDPQIAAKLTPGALESVQKVKDEWKEVSNKIQTWGKLLAQ